MEDSILPRSKPILPLLQVLLDYGPIVLTTALATLASLRAIKSDIQSTEVLQWILVVLGLLATTHLVERFRIIRAIEQKLTLLSEGTHGQPSAKSFFKPHIPDLRERIRTAKTVSINGMSLSRTSADMWSILKERLEAGGDVRLLLVDPEHVAIQLAASRFQKHQDPERLKREVQHALDNLGSSGSSVGELSIATSLEALPALALRSLTGSVKQA